MPPTSEFDPKQLGLPYAHIELGGDFGGLNDPTYLAINRLEPLLNCSQETRTAHSHASDRSLPVTLCFRYTQSLGPMVIKQLLPGE